MPEATKGRLAGKEMGFMDIARALTYFFKDSQWIAKALVAAVMIIIPIIGWLILAGYLLRITRNVIQGADVPLPVWDDFGGDFVRGFKLFLVGVLWYLPALLVASCITAAATFLTTGESDTTTGVASAISAFGSCIQFLLSLPVQFVLPLPITRLAMTDRLSDAFAFSAIFQEIRPAAVDLLIVLGLTLIAGIVAWFGILLFCIGILATLLWSYLFQAHLWGQVRRRLRGTVTEPVVMPV